jgi:hypothetical protein
MGVTYKSVKLYTENPRAFYTAKSGELEVGNIPRVLLFTALLPFYQ